MKKHDQMTLDQHKAYLKAKLANQDLKMQKHEYKLNKAGIKRKKIFEQLTELEQKKETITITDPTNITNDYCSKCGGDGYITVAGNHDIPCDKCSDDSEQNQ